MNTHTFRFNATDSKAVKVTMPAIQTWEREHPDQTVNK